MVQFRIKTLLGLITLVGMLLSGIRGIHYTSSPTGQVQSGLWIAPHGSSWHGIDTCTMLRLNDGRLFIGYYKQGGVYPVGVVFDKGRPGIQNR